MSLCLCLTSIILTEHYNIYIKHIGSPKYTSFINKGIQVGTKMVTTYREDNFIAHCITITPVLTY